MWGERKHRGVDLLECSMPEGWLDWHQTKCFHPPHRPCKLQPRSYVLLSPSLSLPQAVKQESLRLRFLGRDQRSLWPGLLTDGIPSPGCCCCCWPAVAAGIENRPLTFARLLEYASVLRIKGTHRHTISFITPKTEILLHDAQPVMTALGKTGEPHVRRTN